MAPELGPEQAVHGSAWGGLHGGYFSDPGVAQPLVDAVRRVACETRPGRIVDLGGGTGYLLSRFRAAGLEAGSVLVDLDGSSPQLAEAEKGGYACVRGAVETFRRGEVAPPGQTVLWTMRSVLHYAGAEGLAPLLEHLRAQAAAGEWWVHQTACFDDADEAACLNALYRKMGTGKWYPTVADLQGRLAAAGWQTEAVQPAPALALDSAGLGRRYGLDAAALRRIRAEMRAEFGGEGPGFTALPDGFRAELSYRIFLCRAAAPERGGGDTGLDSAGGR